MEIESFEQIQVINSKTYELNIGMMLAPFEYYFQNEQNQINSCNQERYIQQFYDKEYEDSKEETNKLQVCKMAQLQRKKIKKIKKPISLKKCIIQDAYSAELFKLNSGIYITFDGVLRFTYSLSPVSFGFCPYKCLKLEEMNGIGVIDIHQLLDTSVQMISIEDCVNLMMQKNLSHQSKQDLQEQLMSINMFTTNLYSNNVVPLDLKILKEQEYQGFIKCCYQYIEDRQKQQKNIPFSYVIGRYNFIQKQVEISHTGMSKLYLQLLGLNSEQFKTIFLRKQNIDLIQNKADIINQTLKGMFLKVKLNTEDTFNSNITTFDGYPLQIQYIIKNVTMSQNINIIYGNEYILLINQVHTIPKQIQGLIEYRKKIMDNSSILSLGEYIQKELSYLFEDVEYSVQSQQFLEKYYKDNIQDLLNSNQTVECGYRKIFSQNTKEQQNSNTSDLFNQKKA
ncbi:hypothetical protein ABPG74_006836 [Tetrahymena malaccensis]